MFDRIERDMARGVGVGHLLYHVYVTIFHELGHWFGCCVSNIILTLNLFAHGRFA